MLTTQVAPEEREVWYNVSYAPACRPLSTTHVWFNGTHLLAFQTFFYETGYSIYPPLRQQPTFMADWRWANVNAKFFHYAHYAGNVSPADGKEAVGFTGNGGEVCN